MKYWTRHLISIAAPLLLTGCLWGPGKFTSDLALRKDGSFVLDYRGEIVLETADAMAKPPWQDSMAHCTATGSTKERPCSAKEMADQKAEYDAKQKKDEEAAKAFGLPGNDEESNRAFAAKLVKYAGWRSVVYRGKGVYDVDYHFEGRATQDFVFPALPDNDFIIPFIAIRRRADGSVLVTAPAFTGGAGPLGARAGAAAAGAMKEGPVSKAQGRFTIITNGEVLTNNSEDGTAPHALGKQVHWDVGSGSNKIPEALIRLQ